MKNVQKFFTIVSVLGLTCANVPAQVLNLLHTFSATANAGSGGPLTNADGAWAFSDMVLSSNTLYGVTTAGGSSNHGTIFSVNTDGSDFTVLHNFSGDFSGDLPSRHLTLSGGTLYGIIGGGETNTDYGSIFSIDTNGSNYTVIYSFTTNTDGALSNPNGGVILCSNTLYGTAYEGGITNAGSIFSVDTNGNFQLLHLFKTGTDGEHPLSTLVMSGGILYGTTKFGGTNVNPDGTIFSISIAGTNFTVLHDFGGYQNGGDGSGPNAGMILSGNTLYGTTGLGGTNDHGTVFSINTNGSGYTVLHSFSGLGELPQAALLLHGNTLYGTTLGNDTATKGSIFSIGTNGSNFNLLQTFSPEEGANDTNSYGAQLSGSLAMAGNDLYGAAALGGAYGNGTIFSLAIEPVISSLDLAGTNVELNATGGFASNTWSVLESPDVTVPLAEWTPIATNTLEADGDFSITATNAIDPSAAEEFYILEQQ